MALAGFNTRHDYTLNRFGAGTLAVSSSNVVYINSVHGGMG